MPAHTQNRVASGSVHLHTGKSTSFLGLSDYQSFSHVATCGASGGTPFLGKLTLRKPRWYLLPSHFVLVCT